MMSVLGGSLLALGACAAAPSASVGGGPINLALSEEDQRFEAQTAVLSHYAAASLSAHGSDHGAAARHFMAALDRTPGSGHVAGRAFFGLVFAGEIGVAAEIAARMIKAEPALTEDLVRLLHTVEAFAREDWEDVRARAQAPTANGFGYIVNPVLTAWSHAAEDDLEAARAAMKPLFESPTLGGIAEEFYIYMLEHSGRLQAAEERYLDLINSERLTSLQPIIAYADLLVRARRTREARTFLSGQLTRFDNNNFIQREAYRTLYAGGPSHNAHSPKGAAALLFYRLASELAEGPTAEAAIVYLQLAHHMSPHVADIHQLMGSVYETLEAYDEAARAYARILPQDPSYMAARLNQVGALRLADRAEDAATLIEVALAENPGDRQLLTTLADIRRAEGAYAEAVQGYTALIDDIDAPRGQHWWLYFSRGIAFEQLDRWNEAERDLLMALKLNPDQPDLLNYLGYSWADRGQHINEARTMIERALEARPEDGAVVDSLGWVHYLAGNFDEAVNLLERAVKLEPTDVTINSHLGDAYWRAGRHIEARFQWRRALTFAGDASDDQQALLEKLDLGLLSFSQDRSR